MEELESGMILPLVFAPAMRARRVALRLASLTVSLIMLCASTAQAAEFEFTLGGVNYESIDALGEDVVVPFAGSAPGIPSTSTVGAEYSGLVVITVGAGVLGFGETSESRLNDAFYFTDDGGPFTHDPTAYQLAIDQVPLTPLAPGDTLLTPELAKSLIVYDFGSGGGEVPARPYVPAIDIVEYAFVVDLSQSFRWIQGSEVPFPQPVHFAVSDDNYTDNSGDYEIRIIPVQEQVSEPATPITLAMIHAVPDADDTQTAITVAVAGVSDPLVTVNLLSSGSCDANGNLGTLPEPEQFGSVVIELDPGTGAGVAQEIITNAPGTSAQRFVAASVDIPDQPPVTSTCIAAQPDNDSWVRASEIALDVDESTAFGQAVGIIDQPGNQRWFKISVQPGATLDVRLSGIEGALPRDYDLMVFRDIRAAFREVTNDSDVESLHQLSAEFAPSIFSPSIFSPSIFSPSIFSPDAYAPSIFSPSIFSPSIFSPSIFSPSIFSPSIFSPSIFSPSIFSPSIFSPSIFSPSEFSPSIFSPSVFSPENFASAQTRSLISVAAQRGRADERVVADTWQNTGFFYVMVSGKNGQFNADAPFFLTVERSGVSCEGVAPIAGSVTADAGDYETLILWDSGRMDPVQPGNSAAEIAALQTAMASLAARTEVNGKIVDLAEIAHIQALQVQADETAACPYAANLAANGIRDVIGAYRQQNPDLKYVVLAGSDRQIPFFRYPDQGLLGPEQDYDPPVADGTQSQSSLRLNYVLGQDEYGSDINVLLGDSRFPIPKLAVGRLVENALEMTRVIDGYLSTASGVVDTPTSSLVTGYDFLTDAADAVQVELVAGTLNARNDTLVTAADISPADPRSWTADDLRRELLETREDIVYLAGHFSANSALAADYTTSALATELDSSSIDMTNVLVFSAGCHSGYNIVNEHAVDRLTEPRDWTQAFANKGATLIAGTGYQYGDTDFVEYGERLYAQFARELRRGEGPVAIGDALVSAKQRYLAATPDVRGLHRKSIIISTLFGLPMLQIDMPGERLPVDNIGSGIVTSPTADNPGDTLGLETAQLAFDFGGQITEQTVTLNNLDGGQLTATYLQGPDGVTTNPAEPALPLITRDVSVPGLALRGVGFRGGDWREQQVIPLTGAPTTELRGVHTPFTSPINFPLRMYSSNYFGALAGGSTFLHVTPAQHRVENVGDFGATLRGFSAMNFELFYSNNTQSYDGNTPALSAAPSLTNVRGFIDEDQLVFQARVVGDPAAGIQKVWITYSRFDEATSTGNWRSVDLRQNPNDSTAWGARIPRGSLDFAEVEFFVQAVNGVGLVSLDDNFGGYYSMAASEDAATDAGTPVDLLPTDISFVTQTPSESQPFGQTRRLAVTLSDRETGLAIEDASVLFSVGASGRAARTNNLGEASVDLPLNLTPGRYTVQAVFAGNDEYATNVSFGNFRVDQAATSIEMVVEEPIVEDDGVRTRIGAVLSDENGTPLLQRTVYFTVSGGPDGDVTFPVITDNIGRAPLGKRALPPGEYTVIARFLGLIPGAGAEIFDETYLSSVGEPQSLVVVEPTPPPPVLDAPLSCTVRLNYWRPWRSTTIVRFPRGTPFSELPKFYELYTNNDPDRSAFAKISRYQSRYSWDSGRLRLRTGFRTFYNRYLAAKDGEGNRSERITCR